MRLWRGRMYVRRSRCASTSSRRWTPLRPPSRRAYDGRGSCSRPEPARPGSAWRSRVDGAGRRSCSARTTRSCRSGSVAGIPSSATRSTCAQGSDRDVTRPLTALTYQSLATFAVDDEVDEDGLVATRYGERLLDDLHPQRSRPCRPAQGDRRPDAGPRRVPPPARGLGQVVEGAARGAAGRARPRSHGDTAGLTDQRAARPHARRCSARRSSPPASRRRCGRETWRPSPSWSG